MANGSIRCRSGRDALSQSDAEKGFSLNGQPYPLRGVVLWRDQAVYGPVFTESQLRRDVALIREMGANAVAGGRRIARPGIL